MDSKEKIKIISDKKISKIFEVQNAFVIEYCKDDIIMISKLSGDVLLDCAFLSIDNFISIDYSPNDPTTKNFVYLNYGNTIWLIGKMEHQWSLILKEIEKTMLDIKNNEYLC